MNSFVKKSVRYDPLLSWSLLVFPYRVGQLPFSAANCSKSAQPKLTTVCKDDEFQTRYVKRPGDRGVKMAGEVCSYPTVNRSVNQPPSVVCRLYPQRLDAIALAFQAELYLHFLLLSWDFSSIEN
jgi:hypothetical protein